MDFVIKKVWSEKTNCTHLKLQVLLFQYILVTILQDLFEFSARLWATGPVALNSKRSCVYKMIGVVDWLKVTSHFFSDQTLLFPKEDSSVFYGMTFANLPNDLRYEILFWWAKFAVILYIFQKIPRSRREKLLKKIMCWLVFGGWCQCHRK